MLEFPKLTAVVAFAPPNCLMKASIPPVPIFSSTNLEIFSCNKIGSTNSLTTDGAANPLSKRFTK